MIPAFLAGGFVGFVVGIICAAHWTRPAGRVPRPKPKS